MGWYDEDDMEGVINAVNEQLDGAYTLEYTYVALSDYNNVLGTQLASGEGPTSCWMEPNSRRGLRRVMWRKLRTRIM